MTKYQLTNKSLDLTISEASLAKLKGPRLGLASGAGTSDSPVSVELPIVGVIRQGAFNDDEIGYALSSKLSEHLPRIQALAEKSFSKDGPVSAEILPHVLPLQIFQIGNIFVLGVPAEFTSLAGMILKENVRRVLEENNAENPIVTIAGLSNAYSQYVTTPLEYDAQRHEGACTLYGKWTLYAYVELFNMMADKLLKQQNIDFSVHEYVNGNVITQHNLPWRTYLKNGNFKVTKDVNPEYSIGKSEQVEFQVQTHHPGEDFSFVPFFFLCRKKSRRKRKWVCTDFK